MSLFLLLYITVYGTASLYAAAKLAHLSRKAPPALRIAAPVLIAASLALAPIGGHMLHSAGWYRLAYPVLMAGYWGMAFVLWTVCAGLLLDAWNLGCFLSARRRSCAVRGRLSPAAQQKILTALIAALSVWGLVEGRQVHTRTVHLSSPKIPAAAAPVRIVHVTDCHFGLTQDGKAAARIMEAVKEAEPDLLLCTGDLFDVELRSSQIYAQLWQTVEPPLGMFAVMGNHEFYTGVPAALSLLDQCGFRTLRGTSAKPVEWLRVAGVDDPAGNHTGADSCFTDETVALRGAHAEEFIVLLKHQPRLNAELVQPVDLQLSGHTHGGQIFPFHLFVRLAYPLGHGLRSNGSGGHVYVSRGAGNWGPPLRVLAPREITLFLVSSNTATADS